MRDADLVSLRTLVDFSEASAVLLDGIRREPPSTLAPFSALRTKWPVAAGRGSSFVENLYGTRLRNASAQNGLLYNLGIGSGPKLREIEIVSDFEPLLKLGDQALSGNCHAVEGLLLLAENSAVDVQSFINQLLAGVPKYLDAKEGEAFAARQRVQAENLLVVAAERNRWPFLASQRTDDIIKYFGSPLYKKSTNGLLVDLGISPRPKDVSNDSIQNTLLEMFVRDINIQRLFGENIPQITDNPSFWFSVVWQSLETQGWLEPNGSPELWAIAERGKLHHGFGGQSADGIDEIRGSLIAAFEHKYSVKVDRKALPKKKPGPKLREKLAKPIKKRPNLKKDIEKGIDFFRKNRPGWKGRG